ncbi:hypothetical protein [Streptomyces sp. NBC_01264]|uniref:hypothetical protein n=1 Tax=Streptomyces sp. NBC_01264 TaxID=2903804 RepID=UPI00225850D4|nr:hypothetical protein [Streptomyces sp. NBC_01264]MCX4781667.1 hypothetical protein [Streptomyces sp. NBC_01264]
MVSSAQISWRTISGDLDRKGRAGPLPHPFARLLALTRLDTHLHITPTLAAAAEQP